LFCSFDFKNLLDVLPPQEETDEEEEEEEEKKADYSFHNDRRDADSRKRSKNKRKRGLREEARDDGVESYFP
jgi:hypothetical protein